MCFFNRAGRYEIDGYVYNKDEEPKLLITGKWNSSLSYQPCDIEGDPLPGTQLKEVWSLSELGRKRAQKCCALDLVHDDCFSLSRYGGLLKDLRMTSFNTHTLHTSSTVLKLHQKSYLHQIPVFDPIELLWKWGI